jgi:transcriptional regulator with XRE-family HTH domain
MATRRRPRTLLAWRTAQGFTQQTAADYLSLSQSVYSRLEAGRYRNPSAEVILRVHQLTRVSLNALLTITLDTVPRETAGEAPVY